MRDKKISIIVPIYNMEKYLERCVDSILAQTYDNIEVILVDDGSADSSPEMCDRYAEKDGRIKVIHKTNGGLSSARNAGLDVATGDYIGFVDSDDFISDKMYEVLLTIIEDKGVRISGVDGFCFCRDEQLSMANIGKSETLTCCDYLSYATGLLTRTSNSSVCSKLFDAKLFACRRFEEGKLNEDSLLLFYLLMEDKCDYAYTNMSHYYYFRREGSICNQHFGNVYSSLVENNLEIEKYVIEKGIKISKEANDAVLYACAIYLILIPHYRYLKKEKFTEKVLYEAKRRRKTILTSNLRKRDRYVLFAFTLFPRLTKWFIDSKRKNI